MTIRIDDSGAQFADGSVRTSARMSGDYVQLKTAAVTAVMTGTTVVPNDDTIPQQTEGDLYLTAPAITPTDVNNLLEIEVQLQTGVSTGSFVITALFRDSAADAIAAVINIPGPATYLQSVFFKHYVVAGSLSPTVFKVRAGLSSAGTITVNGQSGGRLMGGVAVSRITVREVKP